MKAKIADVTTFACSIPTDQPESDGTLKWNETTIVFVLVSAEGCTGIGYSYTNKAASHLIGDVLKNIIVGEDALSIESLWQQMVTKLRNFGPPGLAYDALSAIDIALWDLKARLLDVSLATLLGQCQKSIPVYGSGGFTSYDLKELGERLENWLDLNLQMVKIKIGRKPDQDIDRVAHARHAIGDHCQLFVDANGAYYPKQALRMSEQFEKYDVRWFEEPVSSEDLQGLRLIRERAPLSMEIAAGEYGYQISYFRRMMAHNAVDVLQADATRCGGVTGFLKVAALAEAFMLPLSSHTAPAIHLAPACAMSSVCHLEYFYDHVRIEDMFFENVPKPLDGHLKPDLSHVGHGLVLKQKVCEAYRVK